MPRVTARLSVTGHAGGMKPIREFQTGLTVPWGFTDPTRAVELLRTYYLSRLQDDAGEDPWYKTRADRGYVGAYFDRWKDGTQEEIEDPDADRFTAEDILAVQTLSVRVRGWVSVDLVERRQEFFADMLKRIPTDVDLWERGKRANQAVTAALELEEELRRYDQVGPTTAAKLIARKRPRLYPIYDSVVVKELGLKRRLFHELRKELTENPALRELCMQLRREAGLPASISVLRIFDVVTWMGTR